MVVKSATPRATQFCPGARAFLFAGLALACALHAGARPLSIIDGIESARIMTDAGQRGVVISPDGARYAMLVVRGDVRADGVWGEVLVGSAQEWDLAEPKRVAKVFSRGLGSRRGFGTDHGAGDFTRPRSNLPVWIDNSRLTFRWEGEHELAQIFLHDLQSQETKPLTRSGSSVVSYLVAGSGTLLYESRLVPDIERSRRLMAEGFSVRNPDAFALIAGYADGTASDAFGHCTRQILHIREGRSVPLDDVGPLHCALSFVSWSANERELVAPSGRFVLLNAPVTHAPESWSRYENPEFQLRLKQHKRDRQHLYGQMVQELRILDVETGTTRPLWNVPVNLFGSTPLHLSWSADESTVVLWPTFVPTDDAEPECMRGECIAQVDVRTGEYSVMRLPGHSLPEILSISLASKSEGKIGLRDGRALTIQRTSGGWKVRTHTSQSQPSASQGRLEFELRQGLNSPPKLFVTDRHRRKQRVVFDPNPQFREISFGEVQMRSWRDADGRVWRGRLYLPVGHRRGVRYPLVVQTHGYARENIFSLYGEGPGAPGTGPGWSVYLAQTLAGRGFCVLQVGAPEQPFSGLANEFELFQESEQGWRAGIMALVGEGLVDAGKVGLMGHSLTGRFVEHALVHSPFRYAAAIAADHADSNYLQAALSGWPVSSADFNGAPPFGEGLKIWLAHAPAFNVGKMHTPLQLQLTSRSEGHANLLNSWELFSRLRNLDKPVEYYIVPNLERGSHLLQNPRQLLAVQSRALQWWEFWLRDVEPDDESLRAEWAKLRELHRADLARAHSQGRFD